MSCHLTQQKKLFYFLSIVEITFLYIRWRCTLVSSPGISWLLFFEHSLISVFFYYFLKISKSSVKPKALPWREENETYVVTAYFKDPSLICSKKHSHERYIGDRLLIQNSSKSSRLVQVPLLEDGLLETVWTEGACFWSMGKFPRFLFFYKSCATVISKLHWGGYGKYIRTVYVPLAAVQDLAPDGPCWRELCVFKFPQIFFPTVSIMPSAWFQHNMFSVFYLIL